MRKTKSGEDKRGTGKHWSCPQSQNAKRKALAKEGTMPNKEEIESFLKHAGRGAVFLYYGLTDKEIMDTKEFKEYLAKKGKKGGLKDVL